MENRLTDYTFSIVEDGQVPLAGNFDSFNYMPVILIVASMLIMVAIVAYTVWVQSHLKRVVNLNGNANMPLADYYFHPRKLIRQEAELEYEALSDIR